MVFLEAQIVSCATLLRDNMEIKKDILTGLRGAPLNFIVMSKEFFMLINSLIINIYELKRSGVPINKERLSNAFKNAIGPLFNLKKELYEVKTDSQGNVKTTGNKEVCVLVAIDREFSNFILEILKTTSDVYGQRSDVFGYDPEIIDSLNNASTDFARMLVHECSLNGLPH